mmetsp:Transcript_9193/g.10496  ORF Transcript_9193/g.10496 Transcript_9193/m.10496 type:complete len:188 (+) Transcript_9193:208-771(+)|eukprot:CAMPEP_0184035568 /NCGR_PEP_ID=MMETSP0955-20130417/26878_1 /TAXON_ID=627963 /ORGANISM="Aplanochytrium sp, Strain PBS07" /LENGTH=187 /DNA_ID=CAMNT_0026322789 /DNA_START=244 /DNA_END=810 /DNA_ORIENTATION=+
MGEGESNTVELLLNIKGKQHKVIAENDDWTVEQVKNAINQQAGLNIPIKYMKLLIKGKFREDTESLSSLGIKVSNGKKKLKGKLLFEEGYHHEEAGTATLEKTEAKLKELEKKVKELYTKVNHRMCTPEDATFEMVHINDVVLDLKGALDESKVKTQDRKTRDSMFERLKVVLQKIEAIKETNRVYS